MTAILNLRNEVPKRAQAVVAIALILAALAVALTQWGPGDQEWPILVLIWLSVFAIAIATVLTVLAALKDARRLRSTEIRRVTRSAVAEVSGVRRSLMIIGVHVGRTYIECGAFDAEATVRTGTLTMKQSMHGAKINSVVSAVPVACANDDSLLFSAAETIVATARAVRHEVPGRLPIGGIGVALPGLLDIPRKIVTMSVKGIPQGTAVAQRLAEAILKTAGAEAPQLFGDLCSGSDSELAQIIFLDNDAKAVARKYVWDHRTIADVACLIVDDGIGAGCVTSGSLLYGHQYSAGEVGHQILPMPEVPLLVTSDDIEERVTRFLQHRARSACSCGRPGLHWEMTSNGEAVMEAIRLFDPDVISTLAARLGKSEPSVDFADLARAVRSPTATTIGRTLSEAEFARVDRALEGVAKLLAAPLGLGIAHLTDVLDLEQVVLTGRVVTILEKHLKLILQQSVAKYALNRRTDVGVVFEPRLLEDIWAGAGLLFLDAGYSQLFPDAGMIDTRSEWGDSAASSQIGHGETPTPQMLFLENGRRP